ncbi:MMPL family transporter [Endozoicomonas sp. SM1973]|uniref:MMPL family transporter n=1 Tax=Spartinivicinus marinus TaxID=2994442 RepID=A0A853IAK9_9GAMM|nr:MMPL family transporter [Spartinivicinus marinus]MCX4024996.1 MMPL family transporter [Spartinivicinus marinus]NYZ67688.1 MMPL family transporter [Spartinivicinus marinus]
MPGRGKAIACLMTLLIMNCIPSLLFLTINNAPEQYLPKTQPSVQFSDELRKEFPEDQVLMVLFEGEGLFSNEVLTKLEKATKSIKKHAKIDRVISVSAVDHIAGTADGFEVLPLMNSKRLRQIKESERAAYIRDDRFALGALIGRQDDVLAMVVRPELLDDTMARQEILDFALQELDKAGLTNLITAVAGPVPLETYQLASMLRDTFTFVPITVLLGVVLIALLFRRLLAVVMTLLTIGGVVNVTLLWFIPLGQPYTLISSMIPSLLAALTMAVLIHFFNGLRLASGFKLEGKKRVDWALAEIKKPATYTVATTAAGLLSLAASEIPPIRYFGIISAFGVLLGFAIVILLLPPIFTCWDKASWPSDNPLMKGLTRTVKKLTIIAIRYPVHVLVVFVIGLVIGIPQIFNVKAETNLLAFFADDHPITIATKKVEEKLTGVTPLEIVIDGEKRDAIKQLESLQLIKKIQTHAIEMPEVEKAQSVVDFVEDMHWGFHEEDPSYRVIPDQQNLVNQYLLLYDGNDLYEIVNKEFKRTRILLNLNVHSSRDIRKVVKKLTEYLNVNITHDLKWTISGYGKLFEDQEILLVEGQVNSLVGAVILIFVMMFLLWRKLSTALLTLFLNLAPVVVMFILMGLFSIWLDMATAMIAGVIVGIAVDDTIHLFHGFQDGIKHGAKPLRALLKSYYQSGSAVTVTTIILGFQFSVLCFSLFQPTVHFGFLTAAGLITALIFDLILMPALIVMTFSFNK